MEQKEMDLKLDNITSIQVKSVCLSYIERMIMTELLNELIVDKEAHRLYVRPIKEDGSAEAFFRNSPPEFKTKLLEKIKDKLRL